MVDSIRIKEIHAALYANKFAFDESGDPRVANLGYYIERIARILGISVNPDGSVRSIRQSKWIEQGKTIPKGWPIAQWGRNQGGDKLGQSGGKPTEDRDGLAYEVRSNRFVGGKGNEEPKEITEGGYVLVENLPQLLHIILDDLDKALGWQTAGANAIPSYDGQKFATYEGVHSLLVEIAYMLSAISSQTSQNLVATSVNQAVLYELLGALGLPVTTKEFPYAYGEKALKMPYPGLAPDAPTLFNLVVWLLANLAPLIGSSLVLKLPEEEEEKEEKEEEKN